MYLPRTDIEPTTSGLQVSCSTYWATQEDSLVYSLSLYSTVKDYVKKETLMIQNKN